jgi:hypothetical protein
MSLRDGNDRVDLIKRVTWVVCFISCFSVRCCLQVGRCGQLSFASLRLSRGVMLLFFRSFRRWQQPPPDQGSQAARAESFLSWMTRTRGDKG